MPENCKSCGKPVPENAVSFALKLDNPERYYLCMKCGGKIHYACLDDLSPIGLCKLCRAERTLTLA